MKKCDRCGREVETDTYVFLKVPKDHPEDKEYRRAGYRLCESCALLCEKWINNAKTV